VVEFEAPKLGLMSSKPESSASTGGSIMLERLRRLALALFIDSPSSENYHVSNNEH
jgi:hypothetical protein